MQFTSEDLMKAMGLKVGDRVEVEQGTIKATFEVRKDFTLLRLDNTLTGYELRDILDLDYKILPAPKCVGDLKCKECDCDNCPIRVICINDSLGSEQDTLFETLEAYKKKDYLDQEIYDILKARLDKEVEE